MTDAETKTGSTAVGAAETPQALELRGVNASYGSTAVLRNVSITVAPGSVTALIGPNGAGKTTSLRVASGLMKPSGGQVFVKGEDVTGQPPHKRANGGLCHIPEGRGVYRNLTVQENLIMQSPKNKVKESIEVAVTTFPILGQRLSQKAGTLSGGEQQMLAMSAAYLSKPSIVLADEPSLGLAPIIVDVVFDFLETLRKSGIALLLVDQYAHRTLGIADKAYILRRGEIVYDGDAETLLAGDMFERYIGENVG